MPLFTLQKFIDFLLTIFEVGGQVLDLVPKPFVLFNLFPVLVRLVQEVDPLLLQFFELFLERHRHFLFTCKGSNQSILLSFFLLEGLDVLPLSNDRLHELLHIAFQSTSLKFVLFLGDEIVQTRFRLRLDRSD